MDVVASEAPTWADKVEAWSTLGGAVVALAAAVFTLWLLLHQIGEARRAHLEARLDRAAATADRALSEKDRDLAQQDRDLARQDRDLAEAERHDAEANLARGVVFQQVQIGPHHEKTFLGDMAYMQLRARLTNFSAGPITSVFVTHVDAHGKRSVIVHAPVIGPNDHLDIQQPHPERDGDRLPSGKLVAEFDDMNGRRWQREQDSAMPVRHSW